MKQLFKYLNNEFSKKEEEEITRKLIQNHYDKSSKEKWEQILEEKHKLPPTKKKDFKKNKLFLKIRLLAASVLLLFLVGKIYNDSSNQIVAKPDTQQLLATFLAEKYDHPSLKKGPKEDDLRTNASITYIAGDYKESIAYYKQITDLEGEDFVFKGLSFLYNDQADQAIPLLQKAIELVPFEGFRVSEEIRWHLSLAYLKNGQFDEAKIELSQLAGNKNGKRWEDALRLLGTL